MAKISPSQFMAIDPAALVLPPKIYVQLKAPRPLDHTVFLDLASLTKAMSLDEKESIKANIDNISAQCQIIAAHCSAYKAAIR